MRIALISDIHSNVPALSAVLDDIDRRNCDRIISLGDVLDMGPQPTETLNILRQRGVTCIGGNHDPLDEEPNEPMLHAIEAWTRTQLSDADRAWVDSWPFSTTVEAEGRTLLCVHGSPKNDTDQILVDLPHADLIGMVGDAQFDVMACGHTHVQLIRRLGKRVVVNVGSVGMPFEKPFMGKPPKVYPWAEYGIVELGAGGNQIELRQCAYDVSVLHQAARDIGMPAADQWIGNWVT